MSDVKSTGTPANPGALLLRARAEARLRAAPPELLQETAADLHALVQELKTHQIELEIQNEELREAQFELARTRNRYRDLYEFAPMGYVSLDADGVVLETNFPAAELLGLTRSQLNGAPLSRFIARADQDVFYHHLRATWASETKQVCTLSMHRPDGEALWMQLESRVYTIASGGGRLDDGVCRIALIDLSALKQARSKLEDSEQRYRRLIESVTSYLCQVRIEHAQIVVVSRTPGCETVTGYTEEELDAIPEPWRTLVPEPDRSALEQRLTEVLAGRDVEPIEFPLRHRDGGLRWVSSNICLHRNAQGDVTAYDSLLSDITTRKAAELALQALNETLEDRIAEGTAELATANKSLADSERSLRSILITAPDAIVTLDPQGRIISTNPATERLFNSPAHELIGQSISALIESFGPPDIKPRRFNLNEFANELNSSSSSSSSREFLAHRKGGTHCTIEIAINPPSAGESIVCILRDASLRKNLEAEVLRATEDEQRRIGFELHDDTQGRLAGLGLIAQGLADRLEDMPAEFGWAKRLADGISDTSEQVHRLALGLMPVEVDARGFMAALKQLVSQVQTLYGIPCRFVRVRMIEIDDNLLATELYKIVHEAIVNAARHSGAKQITLSLTASAGICTLEVLDDGNGIGDRPHTGSGMGLRIMAYRAHRIRGKLKIERREKIGTRVQLRFKVDKRPG